jgi:hypothetical protein
MWNDIWHKKAPQQDLGLTFRTSCWQQAGTEPFSRSHLSHFAVGLLRQWLSRVRGQHNQCENREFVANLPQARDRSGCAPRSPV